MIVALIGYRGCGKTTVGRRLADRMWQKYVDLDDVIVKKAEKTIREIFEQDGEDRFRQLETEALGEVLKQDEFVFGLGGGTVVRQENRDLLKQSGAKVFYLRCDPQELLCRIQADATSADNRPNLTPLGGGIEEIRQVLEQREPIYRQVMTAELDVTRMSPQDACVYIARLL